MTYRCGETATVTGAVLAATDDTVTLALDAPPFQEYPKMIAPGWIAESPAHERDIRAALAATAEPAPEIEAPAEAEAAPAPAPAPAVPAADDETPDETTARRAASVAAPPDPAADDEAGSR
jgi:hypothetical protein